MKCSSRSPVASSHSSVISKCVDSRWSLVGGNVKDNISTQANVGLEWDTRLATRYRIQGADFSERYKFVAVEFGYATGKIGDG